MSNGMDLAVDRLSALVILQPKALTDDLVAQTDTQDQDFTLKAVDDIETDAGFVGNYMAPVIKQSSRAPSISSRVILSFLLLSPFH